MSSNTNKPCPNCNGLGWLQGQFINRPCPCCSDSGTPDLDYETGVRYAAGIDKDGKLVKPLEKSVNEFGHALAII